MRHLVIALCAVSIGAAGALLAASGPQGWAAHAAVSSKKKANLTLAHHRSHRHSKKGTVSTTPPPK